MSKHTPGPWIAIPSTLRFTQGAFNPIFPDGLWHILPANNVERLPICTVDYADDHDEPTRDNAIHVARLIAAAPDLLSVAKDFRQKLATYVNVYPGDKELRSLISACDAAIAKAEGQS